MKVRTILADLEHILEGKRIKIATFIKFDAKIDKMIYVVMEYHSGEPAFFIRIFRYIDGKTHPINYDNIVNGQEFSIEQWDSMKEELLKHGFRSYDDKLLNTTEYARKWIVTDDEAEEIHTGFDYASRYIMKLKTSADAFLSRLRGLHDFISNNLPRYATDFLYKTPAEIRDYINTQYGKDITINKIIAESIDNPFIFIMEEYISEAYQIASEIHRMRLEEGSQYLMKINEKLETLYYMLPIVTDMYDRQSLRDSFTYTYRLERMENPTEDQKLALEKETEAQFIAEDGSKLKGKNREKLSKIWNATVEPSNLKKQSQKIKQAIEQLETEGYYRNKDIIVENADDELIEIVTERMIGQNFQAVNVFKITNIPTERNYANSIQSSEGIHKNEMILWHGSITKNWLSIIENGMQLNKAKPGMFGVGLYFADDADKSRGYSSAHGSRWANGDEDTGFLALFKVRTGKMLELKYSAHKAKELMIENDCDSVKGVKGPWLRKNEYVIYDESQCTIYAIVEVN